MFNGIFYGFVVDPEGQIGSRETQQLNELYRQLSKITEYYIPKPLSYFVRAARSSYLLLASSGQRVVGTGTLNLNSHGTGPTGRIDDVVTHTDFQRRGIAREVMAHLIRKATLLGMSQIRLDSDPSRFAANALYADIGFRHYDGNSYKLFI